MRVRARRRHRGPSAPRRDLRRGEQTMPRFNIINEHEAYMLIWGYS